MTSSTARDSLKPGCFYIRKFCRNIRTKPFLLQNPLKTSSHIEKRRFSAEIRCKRPSYTKRSGISAPRSSHRLFSAGNTLNISRDPVKISPYIFYFSKKCVYYPKDHSNIFREVKNEFQIRQIPTNQTQLYQNLRLDRRPVPGCRPDRRPDCGAFCPP